MENNKLQLTEINAIQEKENQNKVEAKAKSLRKKKATSQEKECEVLSYNEDNNTAIISFDGYGFELTNVKKDPGEKIIVKYTGSIDSGNFKIIN